MTKIMINENMREEVIDAIAEWMADNTDFSTGFLQSHGEYWLRVYSLDELYDDYYSGELEEVINAFMESGCACRDYYEYFVDDNGDLHDADDMGNVVSEMVYDDNKYAEWVLEEIEEGLITEPQGLMEIVEKYSLPSWEDVACKIEGIASDMICSLYKSRATLFDTDNNGGDLVSMCRYIVSVNDTAEYLKKTWFCGADESMYGKIIDDLDNDNLLGVINADAEEYIKGMHVSFEKAIEIVVKNEYLKGRWFHGKSIQSGQNVKACEG